MKQRTLSEHDKVCDGNETQVNYPVYTVSIIAKYFLFVIFDIKVSSGIFVVVVVVSIHHHSDCDI